jgi:HAD superfamily hydrolase (TIGR01509 family)
VADALILDLDGMLVDTVYAHVVAWQMAFAEVELAIDGWRIHRRFGMSGDLLAQQAAAEIGHHIDLAEAERLQARHGIFYRQLAPIRRPLRGAVALLEALRANDVRWAIATSGRGLEIAASLAAVDVDRERDVVVERGDVGRAKPEPDIFLAAQARLGVPVTSCVVAGDAVWDVVAARRAGMRCVGVLSGGYGRDELLDAGAIRVFDGPGDLADALAELGLVELA